MIKNVGFIGAGVMGKSMIRNLMKKGFQVTVYSRTKSKAEDIIAEGAIWRDSAAECAKGQDVIITIVGFPKDVEETYFGEKGIIANSEDNAILIDMTTSSPKLAAKIYDEAKAAGKHALDAPVSGGDSGAKAGTLSIMVGGDKEIFEKAMPVFEAMGTNIIYEGAAGCGQHTKMANQIALTGCIAGVCEAITYARKTGLDIQTMLDSISAGAAGSWQMSNMAPRMLKSDFNPGFFIKHYIKDMNIATEEGREAGADLSISEAVLAIYKDLEAKGLGDLGTQALLKHYLDV